MKDIYYSVYLSRNLRLSRLLELNYLKVFTVAKDVTNLAIRKSKSAYKTK